MGTIVNGRYTNDKGQVVDAITGAVLSTPVTGGTPAPQNLGPTDPNASNVFKSAAEADAALAAVGGDSSKLGINRSIDANPTDPNVAAASSFLNTFTQPDSAATIADRKRKEAADLIDAVNKTYDTQVSDAKAKGTERLSQNNALSIFSGLAGSPEAQAKRDDVSTANQKQIDAINNERALKLASIFTKISDDASKEAEQQKQDATKSAEDILARQTTAKTEAVNNLKLMASSGLVDFDAFKSDPRNSSVYNYALQAVGGSEQALRGLFAINRPQDQLVGTPTRVGDHFVQAYKNPVTGKVSFDKIEIPGGLPTEYQTFQKLGDNLVAIPDGWDGDVTKLRTIAGEPSTMDKLQQEKLRTDIALNQQKLAGGGPDDTVQSLGQQLVNGLLAPSELSKRASGVGSYNAILKAADDYSMKTTGKHFDIAKADRDYKFASRPQTQDTLNYLGSLVGGAGQPGNLDELKAKSDAVNRTKFPALNDAAAWARLSTGDVNMANFQVTAVEVADQIAKILQGGGTGGGTSDAKLQQAANLFNTGFTKDQIKGIIDTVKPLLANRAKSMVNDNPYLSDYADQFGFNTIDPAKQPVGSTFEYNGHQVRKVGEDNFEIIQ